jgi:hypothetical protein
MNATTFDTLRFAKHLKESGFNEEQAEALAEGYRELQDSQRGDLATRGDLREEALKLSNETARLEQRMEGRFTLLQWMIGFNLALTVAVLWLLVRMMT